MKKTIFNTKKSKIILTSTVIIAVLTSGFAIHAMNTPKLESKSRAKESQQKNCLVASNEVKNSNETKTENGKKHETKEILVKDDKHKNSDNTKIEENPSNKTLKKDSQIKPIKKENSQKQQVPNKAFTYKNKNLGICFDIPKSWANKYFIKDNNTEIMVYMKSEHKLDKGNGLLFTITTNIHDYHDGDFLDRIGETDKIRVINGKKYLVGGPTDVSFPEDNPEFKTFLQLNNDRASIIKTIRGIN